MRYLCSDELFVLHIYSQFYVSVFTRMVNSNHLAVYWFCRGNLYKCSCLCSCLCPQIPAHPCPLSCHDLAAQSCSSLIFIAKGFYYPLCIEYIHPHHGLQLRSNDRRKIVIIVPSPIFCPSRCRFPGCNSYPPYRPVTRHYQVCG